MTTKVMLVQGTHGWGWSSAQQWWEQGSPFAQSLQRQGCELLGGARPFIWSTDLDGFGWLLRRPFKRHINWESAGLQLYAYIDNPLVGPITDYVPLADRNIIAHSHALQVVAYACRAGLKINRLITIGSPVRRDMDDVYRAARPNIRAWLHVHSDGSDRIQWLGELGDGHLGIVREAPLADQNLRIAHVSHSRLLWDPMYFPLWRIEGLLTFLCASDAAQS